MKVLIAEDDSISRRLLEAHLERAGHEVVAVADGGEAWRALNEEDAPKLAVLDWMMPVIDGAEVCRLLRDDRRLDYVYVVLLTARGRREDLVDAFAAGVDDFLTKPLDPIKLKARLSVGVRILELQRKLKTKVAELESAHSHVHQLQGLLPICMHCKKIRDDEDTWHRLESYLEKHSDARLTHSLCAECLATHYPQFEKSVNAKRELDG